MVLQTVLWALGLLTALRILFVVGRALYKRLLRPAADLSRLKKDNAWAVITGASDGIGKAFAFELAKRGFNIFLISRTKSKLEEVAAELGKKYNKIQTEILAVDFGSKDQSFYDNIAAALAEKTVGILVNNVGVNYPYPGVFLDTDTEMNESIITINIGAINKMTRIVLPKMVQRKAGGIINVSSLSGVFPAPLLAGYSASKAYIHFFSLNLASEYARAGIYVQSITPSMTASNMSKIRKASLLAGVTTPQVIAKGSVDTLGQEIHWSPFWLHGLIEFVFAALPLSVVLSKINGLHQSIRIRALAKLKSN